jgi:hypothetical protein
MVDVDGFDDDDDLKTQVAEKAARLAELCEALDQWILKHGALPQKWHEAQRMNFTIDQ